MEGIMNTEFKFGTLAIYEIGEFVSNKIREGNTSGDAELTINVSEDEFKLIDEDLFYRLREDDTQEFVPSEGIININFDNVKIIVKNKSME